MVTGFVGLLLLCARNARAATKAREIVANGPSFPARFGEAKRPDHESLPFVATKRIPGPELGAVCEVCRRSAQPHRRQAARRSPETMRRVLMFIVSLSLLQSIPSGATRPAR